VTSIGSQISRCSVSNYPPHSCVVVHNLRVVMIDFEHAESWEPWSHKIEAVGQELVWHEGMDGSLSVGPLASLLNGIGMDRHSEREDQDPCSFQYSSHSRVPYSNRDPSHPGNLALFLDFPVMHYFKRL
jgi:hypothetical protein